RRAFRVDRRRGHVLQRAGQCDRAVAGRMAVRCDRELRGAIPGGCNERRNCGWGGVAGMAIAGGRAGNPHWSLLRDSLGGGGTLAFPAPQSVHMTHSACVVLLSKGRARKPRVALSPT